MIKLVKTRQHIVVIAGSVCSTPTLGLYYESLCPTSRAFIAKEVWPSYQVLAQYMDVVFVAYGKAQVSTS